MSEATPEPPVHPEGALGETVFSNETSPTILPPSDLSATVATSAPRTPTPGNPHDAQGKPFGRYRLLSEVGRGGMGVVWRAWDTQLRRVVALKQVLVEGKVETGTIARFEREARLAAKLRHPNIVGVLDVGLHDGHHYFTAEFVEGRSLADVLEGGPVEVRQAVSWVKGVADALAYAHANGVIHRDVKPANILIDALGLPHVADFGLAKEVDLLAGGTSSGSTLTLTGALVGTPQYMSPEQASGELERIGPASDQFALGAVLYELLTGEPPFWGKGLREMLNAVTEEDPLPLPKLRQGVPADVETICMRTLEKDPARRYASMSDLAADLARFLEGEPIQARGTSMTVRLRRRLVKHRAWIPFAVGLLLLAGGMTWIVSIVQRAGSQVEQALADARAHRSAGRVGDARDAYHKALAINRRCEEAQQGVAWADAEIVRLARVTEEDRKRASEAATKRALAKALAVQEVMVRWAPLAPVLRKLDSIRCSSTLDPAERRRRADEAWGPIQEFVEKTPDDTTARVTARALAGWARWLAGREEEGLAWMREAHALDPELPYGALMEALVCLTLYLDQQPLPPVVNRGRGVEFGPVPPETTEMTEARSRLEALVTDASAAGVWGEGAAQELRRAIDAIRAFQHGRYEEAEEALSKVIGSTAMRGFEVELLFARAKVRYLLCRFRGSLEDMRLVLQERPENAEAQAFLGDMYFAAGTEQSMQLADATLFYDGAFGAYSQALKLGKEKHALYVNRGSAALFLADDVLARRRDLAMKVYDTAISDFKRARTLKPDWMPIASYLGGALLHKAVAQVAGGEEPWEAFDGALKQFARRVEAEPGNAEAYHERGTAWVRRGEAEAGLGRDPSESWRKAMDDLSQAIRLDASDWRSRANRAWLFERLGRHAEAVADYEAILPWAGDREPTLWTRYACAKGRVETGKEVPAPPWVAHAASGVLRVRGQDYAGALAHLEKGLAVAPKTAEGVLRALLARAHLELARACAAIAAGRLKEGMDPKPPTPEERARLVDAAFAHLAEAAAIGAEAPELRADGDFVTLREDRRWEEALRRLKAK